jgi:glycosyltransferase involved in cell wall biosynthesis
MLFLGVDWERKGGAKVVDTYRFLKNRGYDVSLTICGCNPIVDDSDITIIPFLDKNKEEDRRQLQQIMLQTHLLVLPTDADCTPIVLNEAAAFGIPVISTQTGGISSQVEHGVNGFLALDSGDFSRHAEILINDKDLYERMSKNALLKSQEELSWTKWGEEMTRIILSIIKK